MEGRGPGAEGRGLGAKGRGPVGLRRALVGFGRREEGRGLDSRRQGGEVCITPRGLANMTLWGGLLSRRAWGWVRITEGLEEPGEEPWEDILLWQRRPDCGPGAAEAVVREVIEGRLSRGRGRGRAAGGPLLLTISILLLLLLLHRPWLL